jgi:hypothetical protein
MPTRTTRFLCSFFSLFSLLCLVSFQTGAQSSGRLDQRRINEVAASLQRAHQVLIEETGLRREGEHLEIYMARIAAPLPGEAEGRYRDRIETYLTAIRSAEQATQAFRVVPALRDNSPANRTLWLNASRFLSDLPVRVSKTQAAWQNARLESARPKSPSEKKPAFQKLGQELSETLRVVKNASDALRDVHP